MTDEVNTEVKPDAQAEVNDERPAAEQAAPTEGTVPADIQAQLAKLQQDAQTNLNGWQRERADFANYKRRVEKELKESRERGALDAITRMLPVMDDFERALQNIPADLKDNSWVSGTALILKKFDKVLEEYSIDIIDPVGQPFDPHQHEAIGTDASTAEIASGHVTVTLQKGYASGDRVLRPALVRVAG